MATGLAPRLIAYALARTGCRATAEDIAQDALTALVRRWRSAGPPESPDAYTFTIAKRRTGRAIARRALMAPLRVFAGVTVVTVICAAAIAIVVLSRSRADVAPANQPSALAITGRGSLLVVESADGRRWIVGPPARASVGSYVIVVPQ